VTAKDSPPPEIAELADACVSYVREAMELELDYDSDTLPILDHYLRERGRGAEHGVYDLLIPAAGAYFGEVVRRRLGGARWHCPKGHYAAYRLEFEPFFLAFNPMGVALEVLTGAASEGWGTHFQLLDDARPVVKDALEQTDVRDEDYYTMSVRYEAVEQVADLLSVLESQQKKKRVFGEDVYQRFRDEAGSEVGAGDGDGASDGPPS
jgi:hypothetical protein